MLELHNEIIERAREIQTDGYAMSIGEVISMYRDGDLEIHPEFQRVFRWTDEQKSRLIESVLLGIPIPPIFVSQRDDGVWDVVDGVQRLSTLLQFVGEYRDETGKKPPSLELLATEYLPSLAGVRYEAQQQRTFDDVLRRDFKRAKLDFRIVKKESDKDAKFDLFQRLNSGTELSEQEARNCLLVMINVSFYEWMVELGDHDDFVESVAVSERKQDEGFRQELVLRFFLQAAYSGGQQQLPNDLGEYITNWVRNTAIDDSFDREAHASTFKQVFSIVNGAGGDDIFRPWDPNKHRFSGAFSISSFEAITTGLAYHLDAWASHTDPANDLIPMVKSMWQEPGFRENSGRGFSARRRLPRMIHFGRTYFEMK